MQICVNNFNFSSQLRSNIEIRSICHTRFISHFFGEKNLTIRSYLSNFMPRAEPIELKSIEILKQRIWIWYFLVRFFSNLFRMRPKEKNLIFLEIVPLCKYTGSVMSFFYIFRFTSVDLYVPNAPLIVANLTCTLTLHLRRYGTYYDNNNLLCVKNTFFEASSSIHLRRREQKSLTWLPCTFNRGKACTSKLWMDVVSIKATEEKNA